MIRVLLAVLALSWPTCVQAEPHPLDMMKGLGALMSDLRSAPRKAILDHAYFPFDIIDVAGTYHHVQDAKTLERLLHKALSKQGEKRLQHAKAPFVNEEGASIADGMLQAAPICHDPLCKTWTWKIFTFQSLPHEFE